MVENVPILFGHQEAVYQEDTHADGERAASREKALAMEAFRVLWEMYPGHFWATKVVKTDDRGGYLLCVQLKVLMDETRWFTIPNEKLGTLQDLRKMVREAGGHILERFGLARGARNLDHFLDVRATKRLTHISQRMPG